MTTKAPGRVFLDAGVLIAAVLPTDADHTAARDVLRRLGAGEWRSAQTSDFVITEALNFIRKKVKRREPAEDVLKIAFGTDTSPPVVHTVLRIHSGRFARALAHYQEAFDRGLSLTDWTIVAAMHDADIEDLATFDSGFHGIVNVVQP